MLIPTRRPIDPQAGGLGDDPLDELTRELCRDTVQGASTLIQRLLPKLTLENAPRILHMVSDVALAHVQTLVNLGTADAQSPNRRAPNVLPSYYGGSNFETGVIGGNTMMNNETFGASAMQQMVAGATNILSGRKVKDLTEALAAAKEGGLSDEIVGTLTQRLNEALHADEPEATYDDPIPDGEYGAGSAPIPEGEVAP
jgi:hypothetical protein